MRKISLLILLFIGNILLAQRNFDIEEATIGAYTKFAPKSMVAPQWRNDNQLTYLDEYYQNLMSRNESNQWEEEILLAKGQLQNAINTTLPNSNIKLNIFPYNYSWKDSSTLIFNTSDEKNSYYIEYNIKEKKIVSHFKLDLKSKNETISDDNKYIAWIKDHNIIITDTNGNNIAVTEDGSMDISNGSDYTHRQEFGIDKGKWWNPKKEQLLYYRNDQTKVSNYPLVNFNSRVAENVPIKYPMAGMDNEEVTLVIYDLKTNKKVKLQTAEPKDHFLTMVTWDPSGDYVYVGVLNRGQDHLRVCKYNSANGVLEKVLFEEKSSTYTEPLDPLLFIPKKNNEFLYLSDKGGYRQLYLYNTNGKELKKLGYKDVIVKNILGFDDNANYLYYTGTSNRGLDVKLFKVNLKNAKTKEITTSSGIHNISINPSKTVFLDQFSNTTTANDISIVDIKNNKTTTVAKVKNPYEGVIDMPKMELVTVTAADNKTVLNGRIIYPTNFDSTKQYPVMIYVYGGPHAQLIQNRWLGGASLFDYYMAQNGYIVFTLDNRGSYNRGRDFEHVIHRQLGQNEMADQIKGIEFLKSKSFVNKDKIGVYGWSFGGFMTTSLLIKHPSIFKVGVAGGPVMDWKYYEIMYGERYMDTPQENPLGYDKTNLINKADKLNNRLLIIHGAQDHIVVQQHSMEFIEACIKAGKQVDYFLYPSHEHNVNGRDRIHLNQKIADYFFTHLHKPIQ